MSGAGAAGGFAAELAAGMERMMRAMHEAAATGDPDTDFLAMMIPHHEGAVEMARLELVHGRDPLVRQLAEGILAGQQAEIEAMQRRLRILRGRGPGAEPEFPPLGGTRGTAGP